MTAPEQTAEIRPPYGFAAIVGTAILALYVITIGPTTQFWDTSEYIAAAKVLGIPHPPGNPLFVLVAHVWGMVPVVAHYALRINLFAAFTSAASGALLFLVAERFLRPLLAEHWPRRAAAVAGTLVGSTAYTVWNQSVVNEKVYTLSLLAIALVLWLIVRWGDLTEGPRRDRLLLLVGYLVVLGSTNHMMSVLIAPAVAAYVLFTDWRQVLRPWVVMLAVLAGLAVFGKLSAIVSGDITTRVLTFSLIGGALAFALWSEPKAFARPMLSMAVAAVLVGISLNYAFLPIRAAEYPAINEGEPTTWPALQDVLNREQYQKPPVSQRMADLPSQIGNYLQYFTWQYAHDWSGPTRRGLAMLFGLLGLSGAFAQWRRDRRGAIAMTAVLVTVTVVLVYYLNFRYGYSYNAGANLDREVRERDYFFVASFQLWGIWVGLGLASLYQAAHQALRRRVPSPQAWVAASPILLLACIPLAGNWLTASRAGERLARDFAVDLLQSVEPYAILITAGDNDLFPLWYAQEVEGIRRDVLVFNQSLMNTDWHLRQLLRRPQEPFDLEHAALPYRDFDGPMPEGKPLDLTVEGVDSLPLYFDVRDRSLFRVGALEAAIQPGRYSRADLITLQLIQHNLGKRPVYFARTTGPTGDQLGLAPYLLSQGFARLLMPALIEGGPGRYAIAGFGWLDLPRTETLLFDVYHPESAARERPRGWTDQPSENILSIYYITYATYTGLIQQVGDSATADQQRLAGLATDLSARMLGSLSFGR
ncbi:MAG TPA: DUF2723 domain-containing protein [Gemmatimonadales bacterium]